MHSLHDALLVNKALAELSLNHNNIGNAASLIFIALKTNSTLQKLNLSCCSLSEDSIHSLDDALLVNKALAELSLSQNNIGNAVSLIFIALKTNSTLQKLNLLGCSINQGSMHSLHDALLANKSLIDLDLSGNYAIQDAGGLILVDSLIANKYITYLNISLHNVCQQIQSRISFLIQENREMRKLKQWPANRDSYSYNAKCITIEKIDLSLTDLKDDQEWALLAKILNKNIVKINKFKIGSGKNNGQILRFIADLKAVTLQELDISGNDLSNKDTTQTIANFISKIQHTTILNISECCLYDTNISTICGALSCGYGLTTLILHNNKIGDHGVKSICDNLKSQSHISDIDLGSNTISDDGAECIANLMKVLSSIKKINLKSNKINDKGAKFLLEAQIMTKYNCEISIANNPMSQKYQLCIDRNTIYEINITNQMDTRITKIEGNSRKVSLAPFHISHQPTNNVLLIEIIGSFEYFQLFNEKVNQNEHIKRLCAKKIKTKTNKALIVAYYAFKDTVKDVAEPIIPNFSFEIQFSHDEATICLIKLAWSQYLPLLRYINLRYFKDVLGADLFQTAISVLCQTIYISTNLQKLSIKKCNIDQSTIKVIADLFKNQQSIKSLSLTSNNITSSEVQTLTEMLKMNNVLEVINLCDNKIESEGADQIAKAIQINKSIRVINLKNNMIGLDGAVALMTGLKLCGRSIKVLIRNNNIEGKFEDMEAFITHHNNIISQPPLPK